MLKAHKAFGRKINQQEFQNLMKFLVSFFKTEEESLKVFTEMMQFGGYTWYDSFRNKVSLVYAKTSEVIMKNQTSNPYHERISEMIDEQEGIECKFFLFKSYHKCPQMWRLEDNQLIWGVGVHESYKPLQPHYLFLSKQLEEEEKRLLEQKKMDDLKSLAYSFVS